MIAKARSVLVVDDDPLVLAMCRRTLRRMGCDVVESSDAETAIGALVELDGRVDAIVTDNDMPGMSGCELILWVRARWPALPIIMISGGSAIVHDANVLLTKPFSPRDLQATLERLAPSGAADEPA